MRRTGQQMVKIGNSVFFRTDAVVDIINKQTKVISKQLKTTIDECIKKRIEDGEDIDIRSTQKENSAQLKNIKTTNQAIAGFFEYIEEHLLKDFEDIYGTDKERKSE